jgi:hypothetical protein
VTFRWELKDDADVRTKAIGKYQYKRTRGRFIASGAAIPYYSGILSSFIVGAPKRWMEVWRDEVGEDLLAALDFCVNRDVDTNLGSILWLKEAMNSVVPFDVQENRSMRVSEMVSLGISMTHLARGDETTQAYAFLLGFSGITDKVLVLDLIAAGNLPDTLRMRAGGIDRYLIPNLVRNGVDYELALAL